MNCDVFYKAVYFKTKIYSVVDIKPLETLLFSKEMSRCCPSLDVVVCINIVMVQKLTFCKVSIITEGIYFKLGQNVQFQKRKPFQKRLLTNIFFLIISGLFEQTNCTKNQANAAKL